MISKKIAEPILIHGSNFRLESFNDKYVTEEYVSWLRDKEIAEVIISANPNVTIENVQDYCQKMMESNDNYFFAIVMNANDKHIGNLRLGPIDYDQRICRYGMMIGNKDYHNKGIGSEVVKLALDFCFQTLGMHKVFLDVLEHNKPAIKIYEKNGFETEGMQRDQVYKDSKYYDVRIMGIINPKERNTK